MDRFDQYELPEFLANSLDKIGFVELTEIQKQALPILMMGKDLIASAETGSGKTAAFMIPMLSMLLENPQAQGLVLTPTRELAQQVTEFVKSVAPNDREFHVTRLIGGQDIRKQFKSLQRKPRLVVATPGRLIDHLKRNTIQIHKVNQLVLDEGDRMIDMGFAPQLEQILKHLPDSRQTAFFTATIDQKVQNLAKKYLNNPKSIKIGESRPVSKIKQSVIQVEFKDKDECILNELNQRQGSVIVFLKTKYRTDRLTKYLLGYGFKVDLIHGGRNQGQRNRAIKSFKAGKSRILCATDVAARGLDVPHVEHVINFDLPMQDEDYVHRVGRTARNGAEGEAVSFVTPDEHRDWNRLVKKYEIPDALLEVPKGRPKTKAGKKKFGKKKSGSRKSGSKKSGGKAKRISFKKSKNGSKKTSKKSNGRKAATSKRGGKKSSRRRARA